MKRNTCTLEVMTDLLSVYDATEELLEISRTLVGRTIDGDSILLRLLKISDVIKQFSPLYNPYVDWDDSVFGRVLEDRTLSNEKRALMLLQGVCFDV